MGYSEAFINRTKAQLLERNRKLSREIAALNKEHDIQVESYRKVVEENKGLRAELAGVRGALKRQSELREKSEKERDDLKHVADDLEKIQRKHSVLTMESLDNALKQWRYIDGRLSHDLCMPLESLIQMLDNYGVNDFCKLRERLMYGPTDDYSNALANVRKLEKERDGLKESFEKAARRNDELQNEVNRLQQRWTDKFNPEDEMLGLKIWQWMDVYSVLIRHGIGKSNVANDLDSRLDMLSKYQKAAYDLQKSEGFKWLSNRVCGGTHD